MVETSSRSFFRRRRPELSLSESDQIWARSIRSPLVFDLPNMTQLSHEKRTRQCGDDEALEERAHKINDECNESNDRRTEDAF